MKLLLVLFLLPPLGSAVAQKLNVTITSRQSSTTDYSYVVPGRHFLINNGTANCYAGSSNVNCSGSARTTGYSTASQPVSFSVTGATFSLLLPDGRTAVVNCASSSPNTWQDHAVTIEAVETPLVNNIEADFNGKNAKLIWIVSLDRKKTESETYKVLAVQDKQ